MKDEQEKFHRDTRGTFSQAKFEPKTYCFADIGLESTMNFYCNQCSVMSEILLSRYDLYHSFGMLTHITANLNSTGIEQRYGIRVRSRMRELFNLVAGTHNSGERGWLAPICRGVTPTAAQYTTKQRYPIVFQFPMNIELF